MYICIYIYLIIIITLNPKLSKYSDPQTAAAESSCQPQGEQGPMGLALR